MSELPRELKVLSAVPEQRYSYQTKLDWIDQQAGKHSPDIFITPQEYFGGMVIMPQKVSFKEDELLPDILTICETHDMAMILGLVESDGGKNYQRIWFIDPRKGGLQHKITKFALPSYTHIDAGGTYQIHPESDLSNRAGIVEMRGARVAGMFCWEVFSDFMWFAIGMDAPDLVASLIKFGAMGYPKVTGSKKEGRSIEEFGISSGRNVWLERLMVASKWEVNCPILCSTNSWDLPPQSQPFCGMVPDMLGNSTLWRPPVPKGSLARGGRLRFEKVLIDVLDIAHIRGLASNKWDYLKMVGEWPPFEMRTYTMWTKIHRIERNRAGAEELRDQAISEGKVSA